MSSSRQPSRRQILGAAAAFPALAVASPSLAALLHQVEDSPVFKISCTEYSLHRALAAGELDHLDYAPFIKKTFDLDAVEYWSGPFKDKVQDGEYLKKNRQMADDAGVKGLVILVDGEGNLGDPQEADRQKAVDNHIKWLDAAQTLGCHSIRVNAHSQGTYEEQQKLAADGLRRLCEKAKPYNLNVIVENHGGYSSNGEWLAGVMKTVGLDNCGTFPDFGNFHGYDRYKGTEELMPYAKAVSAKSHAFDENGNETQTDYPRMMKIVTDAGYHGYVGIEYEGSAHSEVEGIRLTRDLLRRIRDEMAST